MRAQEMRTQKTHTHTHSRLRKHIRARAHTHTRFCAVLRCLAASTLSDPETLAHLDALDRLPDYHDFGDHCSQIPDHPYTHTRIHAHAHVRAASCSTVSESAPNPPNAPNRRPQKS